MSMIQYLDELDAKATDYAIRVQIACAQAIVEAIREQTVAIEMLSTMLTLPKDGPKEAERQRVVVTVSRWDDDKDTMSFDGTTFTTVRPCRDCGVLICGGPTRCLYCAGKLPASAPGSECTGIAASWCPVHGNCSCPRDEEGVRFENKFGVACPLHGLSSNHGNAEIAAVERASAPVQWLPSGAEMADRFGGDE